MKKIILLSLIMLVLGGLFSSQVYAVHKDIIGDCLKDGKHTQTTEANCKNIDGSWSPPDNAIGTCVRKDGSTFPSGYEQCLTLDGNWLSVDYFDDSPGNTGGKTPDTNYVLLAPLPCPTTSSLCVGGKLVSFDPTGKNNLGKYLNIIIIIFIGCCGVTAVVVIVIGGVEYMTSELPGNKEHGKERILQGCGGLVIALFAWPLLNQINPDLLKSDFSTLEKINVTVQLEPETGIGSKTVTVTTATGAKQLASCDESRMVMVNLFGHSAEVYKGAAPSLNRINAKWLAMPEATRYKVSSVGGYNCREVTGKPGFMSAHAFGVALDINPATNPYGKVKQTDMPPEFVQLFTSEGWGWGGNWGSVKDPMHFSKFPPPEGGNGVFEEH